MKTFPVILINMIPRFIHLMQMNMPLYNEDSTNFNSLNAIIQTQGKPTGIPDLFYYDVSYDRFNYISKKEITDTSGL